MTRRGVGVVLASVLLASACTVHDTVPPALAGPSELALSLVMSATPDHVTQDGSSTSTITVIAKDANGTPLSNVEMRFDITVNNKLADFGGLSSKTAVTNGSGRATVVYTAPVSSVIGGAATVVGVIAEPVGTNYSISSVLGRQVAVIVTPPPPPPPVPGAPTVTLTYSPTSPKVGQMINFVATATPQAGHQIINWEWSFGDTQTSNETGFDAQHSYDAAGNYSMSLLVRDDMGRSGYVSKPITVVP
jgi:PKD repeat protein